MSGKNSVSRQQFVDAVVTGAGGFIGGHMVRRLMEEGLTVRAIDIKPFDQWYQKDNSYPADNRRMDLRDPMACDQAVMGAKEIYNFAADMGGMGFIETHKADCMLSVLINTNLLKSARMYNVSRYFFASSACVYPDYRQIKPEVFPLAESDAYPASPEDGYGWEKLFSERMCRHFREDYGIETRVARFHNVYGPYGTWRGGREKAPAAICRKVIEGGLEEGDNAIIEIWGDGEQTRSFTFIDDAIHGTELIMRGDYHEPVNVGSSELVSINDLVSIVEGIAGYELHRQYDLSAPQGVRGRNSDNKLIKLVYNWEPRTHLEDGLRDTYAWILKEHARSGGNS
jgi:GDP-D-mannose 3', 5'-epimerase